MAVAKTGMAPRQLAEQVLSHLDLNGIANKVEIAGPGFINIFLDPAFGGQRQSRASVRALGRGETTAADHRC